jgi:hypothetical protein
MVKREHASRAGKVLQKIEEEKKINSLCPVCYSHNIAYINTMRRPTNWLSAAVTFFLGSIALMPEQRYHCFHCRANFSNRWMPGIIKQGKVKCKTCPTAVHTFTR